ncbi:unnamed protein product [Lampetra fluviatilis]
MPGAFGVLGTFRMFAGDQEKLVEVEEPRVPRARLSLQALPKHSSDHVVLLPYGPTLFRIAAMVMKQRKGRSLSGRAHGGVVEPNWRATAPHAPERELCGEVTVKWQFASTPETGRRLRGFTLSRWRLVCAATAQACCL